MQVDHLDVLVVTVVVDVLGDEKMQPRIDVVILQRVRVNVLRILWCGAVQQSEEKRVPRKIREKGAQAAGTYG